MNPVLLEIALAYFRAHEGVVNHCYLDTVGLVTCGVGFMVPTDEAMIPYPFVLRGSGALATAEQKRAEWHTIKALPAGRYYKFYAPSTKLILSPSSIDALLAQKLMQHWDLYVAKRFPNAAQMPQGVQLGLLDMAYSMGDFAAKYPNFTRAVNAGNWAVAAAHSHRDGVSEDRNQDCAALFRGAAVSA